MAINWNDGQCVTLNPGDSATAEGLNDNQLYGLFFHNINENENAGNVHVRWSNQDAEDLEVPGAIKKGGRALVAFLWGGDSANWVSASIPRDSQNTRLHAFIGSASLPKNTTCLHEQELDITSGTTYPYQQYCRFYGSFSAREHSLALSSGKTQFIAVEMTGKSATAYILNKVANTANNISYLGEEAEDLVQTKSTKKQNKNWYVMGNDEQHVFFNPDSVLNSERATITVAYTTLRDEHSPLASAGMTGR